MPRRMDFSSDGRIIAAAYDTAVYIWDGFTGQPIVSMDHYSYLWTVAISSDGTMVASGGENGRIKVWDVKTGQLLHTIFHGGTIWSLAFSPDNSLLASASLNGGNARIWRLIDASAFATITDVSANSLAFSPDSKLLGIGTYDQVILWDIPMERATRIFEFDWGMGNDLRGVLFSSDGKLIAAASSYNIAMVWEIDSGKKLNTIAGKHTIIALSEGALAFSPDKRIIAAGNDDGDVIFWDVLADRELYRIGTTGSLSCYPMELSFGPDGNIFEIACMNGSIQFWGIP